MSGRYARKVSDLAVYGFGIMYLRATYYATPARAG